MKIVRYAALLSLFATLSLRAQTPPPPPPPPPPPTNGPTMEQTIGFINDTFTKMGEFKYDKRDYGPGHQAMYVGYIGSQQEHIAVHRQSVTLQENLKLVYSLDETHEKVDEEPVLDKKGRVVGKDAQFVTTKTAEDVKTQIELPLDKIDPRSVTVATVYQVMYDSEGRASESQFLPPSFAIKVNVPSAKTFGATETVVIGTFLVKDLAEHVAKAYIHAIVLCQKPESAPLF